MVPGAGAGVYTGYNVGAELGAGTGSCNGVGLEDVGLSTESGVWACDDMVELCVGVPDVFFTC